MVRIQQKYLVHGSAVTLPLILDEPLQYLLKEVLLMIFVYIRRLCIKPCPLLLSGDYQESAYHPPLQDQPPLLFLSEYFSEEMNIIQDILTYLKSNAKIKAYTYHQEIFEKADIYLISESKHWLPPSEIMALSHPYVTKNKIKKILPNDMVGAIFGETQKPYHEMVVVVLVVSRGRIA